MDPCVGFLVVPPPGRLAPAVAALPELGVTHDCRPGSGMIEERREPLLPESEKAGDPGCGLSGAFVVANAASSTSLRN